MGAPAVASAQRRPGGDSPRRSPWHSDPSQAHSEVLCRGSVLEIRYVSNISARGSSLGSAPSGTEHGSCCAIDSCCCWHVRGCKQAVLIAYYHIAFPIFLKKKAKQELRESCFCFLLVGTRARSALAVLVHSFHDGVTVHCFRMTWDTCTHHSDYP